VDTFRFVSVHSVILKYTYDLFLYIEDSSFLYILKELNWGPQTKKKITIK
jgi:hypothetical protein